LKELNCEYCSGRSPPKKEYELLKNIEQRRIIERRSAALGIVN